MAFAIDVTSADKRTRSGPDEQASDWGAVADRVRRDHATIRALLDEVERACAAAQAQRLGGLDRFRQAVWDLYLAFDEHLSMEEAQVAPILRTFDAWGEFRAINMVIEHNEQRRVLLELVEDTECDTRQADALISQALAVVAGFRKDMEIEERSLSECIEVPVVRDQEDG